jgi:1-acyl-sn-glycerol-3-phosphate acyltransferase
VGDAPEKREYGRLYPVARAVLSPVFKTLWKVETTGLEHVPTTGGAIFCPNHTSVIDSFFLPLVLPRRITFVGKAEYLDSWKTRYLFPAMGMIPIDRTGGDAAERALNTAARVIEAGEFFGIYPEGTRARDGKLHRGRTGAARLALRTGAPIIPVGITGTREIQPPDAKLPRPFRRAAVHFGRPIDVGRYLDRADDRLVSRQIIDEVMFEIRELTGQEYVDEYASKKAEGIPAAPPAEVITLEARSGNGDGRDAGGAPAPRRSSADVLQPRPTAS